MSRDVPEQLIPKDDNNCAGLPHTLKLAVGAQVMLRRNIMCEDSLVNGSSGEIVGFKWSDGVDHQAQPGILPAPVLVKFNDLRVVTLIKCQVVIVKLLKYQFQPNSLLSKLQQTQLPLIPCWAALTLFSFLFHPRIDMRCC